MVAVQDLETRDARASVENGRKLKMCDTNSGGSSVRNRMPALGSELNVEFGVQVPLEEGSVAGG